MTSVSPETERGEKPALGGYFIIPLLASALTIYFLVSTLGLVWEARSTGTFIGIFLLLLCGLQFFRLGMKVARGEASLGLGELVEDNFFNRQRLWLLVLMTAFVLLLPVIGTTVGLFLVMIAMMRVTGVTSLKVLILVAACTSASVHALLIYALGSQLPQGVFKPLFSAIGI
jgi:hypothetical protein